MPRESIPSQLIIPFVNVADVTCALAFSISSDPLHQMPAGSPHMIIPAKSQLERFHARKSQNSYQAYSIDMPMSEETYSYTYSLSAASAFIDFIIVYGKRRAKTSFVRTFGLTHRFGSVEPLPERPGIYTFSLSMKVDAIERDLCEPINMRLTVDPSKLDFSVL
jgi:hypothetical protein